MKSETNKYVICLTDSECKKLREKQYHIETINEYELNDRLNRTN